MHSWWKFKQTNLSKIGFETKINARVKVEDSIIRNTAPYLVLLAFRGWGRETQEINRRISEKQSKFRVYELRATKPSPGPRNFVRT